MVLTEPILGCQTAGNRANEMLSGCLNNIQHYDPKFLTASGIGVHWYVSRPDPGLLNAGSKGRTTASLPLQLSTQTHRPLAPLRRVKFRQCRHCCARTAGIAPAAMLGLRP